LQNTYKPLTQNREKADSGDPNRSLGQQTPDREFGFARIGLKRAIVVMTGTRDKRGETGT